MSRLQKKCFVGATGIHLLLLVILFVGPAFFMADKVDDSPVLTFIPTITTDSPISGGGNPRPAVVQPPPQPQPEVQPPVPQPQPQPVRQPDPEPPKVATPKITKPDPDSLETKTEKKPHQVKVSDTVVKIKPTKPTNTKPSTQTSASNERQQQVAKALNKISGSLSSSTKIEMPDAPDGPGGGGPSYADYAQVVRKIYTDAWTIPADVNDDEATVKVRVTIARGGNVVSSSIIQSSGSPLVDRSIQATLDRVTFVAPFPAGAKDSQRTFTLSFSLKAKKLLG